ncbi:MAG: dihydrolipoamide acetyltransferase family protein [Kiritimatiellia bacterium]
MATELLMPRQGQSVESCILVDWLVKEGDSVTAGQPLASIETDKAVFEVESPADGVMLAQFFPAGEDIPVLTVIGAIGAAGEDVSSLRPGGGVPAAAAEQAPAADAGTAVAATPAVAVPAAVATPVAVGAEQGVSPRARKLAAEKGMTLDGAAGSGPNGRVLARDVEQLAASQPRLSAAARAAGVGSVPAVGSGPGGMVLAGDLGKAPVAAASAPAAGVDREIPIKGIRKLIAQKMRESLSNTAQITLDKSFDATALLAYREKVKMHADALGLPNITINDLIAYVCVRTLVRHPGLNAHFLGDRIIERGEVNLGIATDTERGLMVPVVHGSDQLSLRQLSDAIKPLVRACQSGSINPDLLQGGTFTITNLGILGVESFTPVLNVPEVAILGVSGLFAKPVFDENGSVKHVQAINLSLTVDHQAVDGAPAARFLKDLCLGLEQIELVLAG